MRIFAVLVVISAASPPAAGEAGPNFAAVFGGATGQTVRDSSGNFYIAGSTNRPTIATTPGAFQTIFGPTACGQLFNPPVTLPCYHGFVAKISPDGSKVLFATYLGGSSNDYINSVAVDTEGTVFVAGVTRSRDFPVTASAYSQVPTAAFVTKLSPSGDRILASTFLPGVYIDRPSITGGGAKALALDRNNSLYIAGATTSDGFPATAGAFQTFHYPGYFDAFVIKMDSSLSKVSYATLLGGTYDDIPNALYVDDMGAVYLGGYTTSTPRYIPEPAPAKGLALFPAAGGGYYRPSDQADAFIAKLSAGGVNLVYSAVFGSVASDWVSSVAVDSKEAVYATGFNGSFDFPTTPGAFQTSFGGAFVLKLAPEGSWPEYATLLGGPRATAGPLQVDSNGRAFIQGVFSGFPQPATPDALNPCAPIFSAGDFSNYGYFTILDPSGTALAYSTHLDRILLFDDKGNIWLQGAAKVVEQVNIFERREPRGTCVANAASFVAHSAAPGEIVSVFGPRIGPDLARGPQFDSNGRVGTRAEGISVLFNGAAAPLLHLSKNQINAVVPFEVTGPQISVEVMQDGRSVARSSVRYADSSPGIFTVSGTGYGQAVAWNEDGALNSQSSPAPQGSVVSFYATGLGKMKGATDGYVPREPVASPTLPVFAGLSLFYRVPMEILYVGDAPGFVQGLVQINARVPRLLTAANPPATRAYLTVGIGLQSPFLSAAVWIR